MKAQHNAKNTVRRSIALPRKLVEDAKSVAPRSIKKTLIDWSWWPWRIFPRARRKQTFEEAMKRMGGDPEISAQCQTIVRGFGETEGDGLAKWNWAGSDLFCGFSADQRTNRAGFRPVLVVSADAINRQPLVVSMMIRAERCRVNRDYPPTPTVTKQETGSPKVRYSFAFRSGHWIRTVLWI